MGDAHDTNVLRNQVNPDPKKMETTPFQEDPVPLPSLAFREPEGIASVSTQSVADIDDLSSICSSTTVEAKSVSSVIRGLSLTSPAQPGVSQKWRIPKRKSNIPTGSLFNRADGKTFSERIAELKEVVQSKKQDDSQPGGSRRKEQPSAKRDAQAAKKPRPEFALNEDDRRITREKTDTENLLSFGVIPNEIPKEPLHPFWDRHPLGKFVGTHQPPYHLEEAEIALPTDRKLFPMIGEEGYRDVRMVRKLFNTAAVSQSVFAFQTLEAAVFLRETSQDVLDGIFEGRIPKRVDNSATHKREWPIKCRAPPPEENARACLFQVIYKIGGRRLVMQSMDHLVYLPDRRDLTFIIVDDFGTNILSNTRGLEESDVAIGDCVWVYGVEIDNSVKPHQVGALLERCRATNGHFACADLPILWRATKYAPVESGVCESLLAFVLAKQFRENTGGKSFTRAHLAIQGSATPTPVTAAFFKRKNMQVEEHSFIRVDARVPLSNAVRFSEPPSSTQGFNQLCAAVRFQIPALSSDAIFPLDVAPLEPDTVDFIDDLLGDFRRFPSDKNVGFRNLAAIFAASASALAAETHLVDDRENHEVEVTTTNPNALPLSMNIVISGMDSSRNWAPFRKCLLVFERYAEFPPMSITANVFRVDFSSASKKMTLVVQADCRTLSRSFSKAKKEVPNSRSARLAAKVRLLPENMDLSAEFKEACSVNLLKNIPADSVGMQVLENVFQRKFEGPKPRITGECPEIISVKGKEVILTEEQKEAIRLVRSPLPISAIQASPGSGKTLLMASTLALEARGGGGIIVATAVTNMAVAALALNLASLDMVGEINFVRFVSESARANLSVEKFDLIERLKQLQHHPRVIEDSKRVQLVRRFVQGREVIEGYARDPSSADAASEQERSNFLLAEKSSGKLLRQVVKLLFEVNPPKIVLCTIASFLRLTGDDGLFQEMVDKVRLLACDEASQIGEISLAALVSRSPTARQVYIGDRFQLPPYTTLNRETLPARIGASPVLETIERSHPDIVQLANVVTYNGLLKAGVNAKDRSRVCDRIALPNRRSPICFVEVEGGEQMRTPARSYRNALEADAALTLVERLLAVGFHGKEIAVLSYYKCQQRAMEELLRGSEVEVATVDSIQGREKSVIIILTTRTDPHEDLSFLADARRLNVALTRAREGLFVIGKSLTVAASGEEWLRMVTHCGSNGLFVNEVGELLKELEEAPESMEQEMEDIENEDKSEPEASRSTSPALDDGFLISPDSCRGRAPFSFLVDLDYIYKRSYILFLFYFILLGPRGVLNFRLLID